MTASTLPFGSTIRQATIQDLPGLMEIETRAFAGDRITRRGFSHLLTRANAISLVDEDRGRLRGYVTVLFRRRSSLARLYSIAVHPDWRGRGRGAGLLEAAERESAARGCRALRLEVHPRNSAARLWYARCGFREIGGFAQFYEDGSDAIRLEKALGDRAAARRRRTA